MKTKKELFFAVGFFVLSVFFNFWGIFGGLPQKKSIQNVFKNEQNLKDLTPYMLSAREEVYDYYSKTPGSDLLKNYILKEEKENIFYEGAIITVEKEKIHSARSVLMQNRFPDEQKTLNALSRIRPEKFQFNPGVYQYGGIYFYFAGAGLKLCQISGICKITSDISFYFFNTDKTALLYVLPKAVGGFFASLAVFFIFFAVLKLWGFPAACFSAFFWAVSPSIAFEAHAFKPYAFFLFFFSGSLYFALMALKNESKIKRNCFLSGIFAGFSGGSMLLGSFAVFSSVAACFFIFKKDKKLLLKILFMVAFAFLTAFFLSNPHYLLSFNDFIKEIKRVSSAHSFHFSLSNMLYFSFFEAHKILSWPVYVLAVFGGIVAVMRKDIFIFIISAYLLPYFLYTSNAHWDISHYSMPLLPGFALLAAYAVFVLFENKKILSKAKVFIFALCVFLIGNSVYYKLVFKAQSENLLKAGGWMTANIPKKSSIGFSVYPFFGFKSYPPFPIFDYQIKIKEDADYYVLNDINNIYRAINLSYRDEMIDNKEFFKNYKLEAVFSRRRSWLDKIFSNNLYTLFEQDFYIYKKIKNPGK